MCIEWLRRKIWGNGEAEPAPTPSPEPAPSRDQSNMPKLLITRPSFELATNYGAAWLGLAVNDARSNGWDVRDLYGTAATPENIIKNLTDPAWIPDLCVLFGHGNPTVYTAQDQAVVFKVCHGDEVLSGRISYFLSCLVAQQLGPDTIAKGAKSFMGYYNEFVFMIDPNKKNDPLSDQMAKPFFDSALEPIRTLVRGGTMKMAYDNASAKFDYWIKQYNNIDNPEIAEMINYLNFDKAALTLLGEGGSRAGGTAIMGASGWIMVPALIIGIGAAVGIIMEWDKSRHRR